MVFAIIGTVLAAIQVIIAGTGAGNLHDRHGAAIDIKTDCYYCSEVSFPRTLLQLHRVTEKRCTIFVFFDDRFGQINAEQR